MKNVLAIFLIYTGFSASAQTCCTGGVPLLGAYAIPKATQENEIGFHAIYNYNHNSDLVSGSDLLGDSHIQRNVNSILTQIDYSPIDKFSISIAIPYLWQEESTDIPSGNGSQKNHGIGDISLWLAFHNNTEKFSFSGALGFKAPVGDTGAKDKQTGISLPLSLQNGSGSWDIGINIISSLFLGTTKKFSLENQLSARINTPGKSFEAHKNYQFGHRVQLVSALSYHFLLHTLLTDLFVGVIYQNQQKDKFNGGFANENTGGNWMNITLGGNFFVTPELYFSMSTLFPVYRSLNGLQLSTTWQGAIGINYLISIK